MSSPQNTQAANIAFSATVASALARSIRDTPLRPRGSDEALPVLDLTDVPADFSLHEGEEAA
ncbi:hypothetical protein [Pseudoxanthomonas sp. JBR18]|uniref:hypothetical protein n=1 Tax=Pseudoxanthomonas sp. JBR18 TaxID=2969308 RepID=UPI0023057C3B|nr:hypothetical protein [Pseudoxanthomonas sp. JBR18]WCE04780.1 hypothetical protein PJ250_01935 [Pseudoxanthomonas sp. JBR18]